VTGFTLTDRSYKRMVCGEHLSDSPGCKQWNVHRGKEHCINLVFQILQSDPDRIKHMSCCIVFVSKKDYIIGGKMALQHICLISCYHNYFRNPGLPEIIDHSLGNGNGSKLKHGFKVSHS